MRRCGIFRMCGVVFGGFRNQMLHKNRRVLCASRASLIGFHLIISSPIQLRIALLADICICLPDERTDYKTTHQKKRTQHKKKIHEASAFAISRRPRVSRYFVSIIYTPKRTHCAHSCCHKPYTRCCLRPVPFYITRLCAVCAGPRALRVPRVGCYCIGKSLRNHIKAFRAFRWRAAGARSVVFATVIFSTFATARAAHTHTHTDDSKPECKFSRIQIIE